MSSRLVRYQVGVQRPERGATPDFPVVRLGATLAPTRARRPSAGMGTRNFIAQILDIYAALDQGRKQQLIDFSSRLAEEQLVERRQSD